MVLAANQWSRLAKHSGAQLRTPPLVMFSSGKTVIRFEYYKKKQLCSIPFEMCHYVHNTRQKSTRIPKIAN